MTGWAVLDRVDPAPGDVSGTLSLAQRFLDGAVDVEQSTARLRSVAAGTAGLQMAGDYAASFTEALEVLPGDLNKLAVAYRGCGRALTTFANSLESAKTRAGAALNQGTEADTRYRAAVNELRLLLPPGQQHLAGNGLVIGSFAFETATLGMDEVTREQIRAAARRARHADDDLDRARSLADQAAALRGDAEDRCAREISSALDDSGLRNRSWWQKAWDVVSKPFRSWDAFIDLCEKVALVAGIAAMLIGGPIGWALLAASLTAGAFILGNDLNRYRKGEVGLGTIGFDMLGMIPGGKAGSVGKAFRDAGGFKTLAGVVGRQGRNTVTAFPHALNIAGGMRGAVDDPRLFARAWNCRFVGRDPIDVVSGEMVMQMTDFELPGLLPITLQRTYVSRYGVGRWFGPSWSSFLDQRLEIDSGGVCFAYTEAVVLSYPPVGPHDAPVLPEEGPRLTLARNADGEYVIDDRPHGLTLTFAPPPDDGTGAAVVLPLSAVEDRHGNRIELGYDAPTGVLSEIRHTGGYVLDVATENAQITGFTLRGGGDVPDVLIVSYGYDARGRMVEVINSSGQPLQFTWDDENRITGWQDRIGTWYRYTYNGGRVVTTAGSAHCLDGALRYDPANQVTVEADSTGAETTYHYNELGQVERVIDPLGGVTLHEWDRYDRKQSQTDPLGRVTRYGYDEHGNLAEVTRPDGLRIRADFNQDRQPTRIVQADGAVWQHEYDSAGSLLAVTDPGNAVARYTYNDWGALASVTDAVGHTTRVQADAAGLPLSVTNPLGATTILQRDAFGRVTSVTDPLGNATRYTWTVEGKLASQILPDGATERWRYDGEGSLVEYVDAIGQSTTIEQTYFDLPAVRTAPDGSQVAYTYDTELRLTSVTEPRGLVWRYDYDAAGHLVRETDYDGRILTYHYDRAGQLTERVNGAGESIEFSHDPLGNVVERRTATALTTLSYDPVGRLIRATNPDADVEFERDPLGRVLAETINGRTMASFYDAVGNRVARRTPSGVESRWNFDAAGQPVTLQTAGQSFDFTYDAAGREISRRMGAAGVLNQSWDSTSRLTSQHITNPAGDPLQQRTWTYRPDGYVTSIDASSIGRRDYTLDPVGQITAVTGPNWNEQYRYDPSGNIIEAHWPAPPGQDPDEGSGATGLRSLDGSRIRVAGNMRYEYDAQGRLIMRRQKMLSSKARIWHYEWDADDRLVSLRTPNEDYWSYAYDALGRRIEKSLHEHLDAQSIQRLTFGWDGSFLSDESSVTGEGLSGRVWVTDPLSSLPVVQHSYEGDSASLGRTTSSIAIPDKTGLVAYQFTSAGQQKEVRQVSLWGTSDASDDRAFLFSGQYRDEELGLAYSLFRYYDPQISSFISKDPLGLKGSLRLFGYVANPTVQIDPLGLSPYIAGKPRARIGKDVFPDEHDLIHPPTPEDLANLDVNGISSFDTMDNLRRVLRHGDITSPHAPMPEGVGIVADGSGVGGPRAMGHHTFYPTRPMTTLDFNQLVRQMNWKIVPSG